MRKDSIERKLIGVRIDKELVKDIKQIALDEEKDFYVVMEEALHEHVKRKGKGRRR